MELPSFLNIAREPEKADAIFVFAGREERKRFGVELFKAEYAPRLIRFAEGFPAAVFVRNAGRFAGKLI